jgi:DNA-binding CsgD family transcriptional regulator
MCLNAGSSASTRPDQHDIVAVPSCPRTAEISPAGVRLHGRAAEQRGIDALLGAARAGFSAALLLRGDVGVGKTALLEYAVAGAAGMVVLRCQGDPAESDLPLSGLQQLLQPVLPALRALPGAAAEDLVAALGSGCAPEVFDPAVMGTALHAALKAAAGDAPVLCIVDDAQWLDRASARALAFAARRLSWDGVGLLVAMRDGEGDPVEPAGVPQLWLEGLEAQAAASLLRERAGPQLAPEVTRQLVELTGGLPLALVEVAANLTPAQLAGSAPLPHVLAISPRLRHVLLQDVRRLATACRRLLLLVATAGVERLDIVVEAGARLGLTSSALRDAEAAGLVRIDEGVASIASRLIQAAVYREGTFFERREAHLALAAALREQDDDRRVWHEAAAALSPDEGLSTELERSAQRAGLRGDIAARASGLRRAAELTPDGPERGRRLSAAATACWLAGQPVQAAELLRHSEQLCASPFLAADNAELRGEIELGGNDPDRARESLVAGADRVAVVNPARALDLLVRAGGIVAADDDAAGACRLSARAMALADPPGPGTGALLRGLEGALTGIQDSTLVAVQAIALAVETGGGGVQIAGLAAALGPGIDLPPVALESALRLLSREVGRLRTSGAVGPLPGALASLAWLELWADRHRSSQANAAEGIAWARRLDQPWALSNCAVTLALLAALRGQEMECAAHVELHLSQAEVRSSPRRVRAARWALALSELSAGRFAEALARFGELAPSGSTRPSWCGLWSRPDAIEAAVRSGNLQAARAALDVLERCARPDWPAPAAALLERSRALVAADSDAEGHFEAALALHEKEGRPFQEARTRLLWGEHLRRSRRRTDAREQLRTALSAFEQLEARPWAARARAELGATGESGHSVSEWDALTPQELRIAQLVAHGCSNRDVAERLFLSPRTVGYHLANVFQKLGVSSRTRLAYVLLDEGAGAGKPGRSRTGLSPRAAAAFRAQQAAETAAMGPMDREAAGS